MNSTDQFSRGVLYSKKSEKNYVLTRVKPSRNLADLIETFWFVRWDLPHGEPHVQQNIPDPCINMVFEAHDSKVKAKGYSVEAVGARIVGAVTRCYSVELAGKGQIFGVKFRPGGFYGLTKLPVSKFTDKSLGLEALFGPESRALSRAVNATSNIGLMVRVVEEFFTPRVPESVESVNLIGEIIDEINQHSTITRVNHLSARFSLSERSLQRLFKDQVGVSPKWTIRKYRMQEVLSRLEQGDHDWQQLVHHLDYFDQSHFIKDFKDLVGVTPTQYIKNLTGIA